MDEKVQITGQRRSRSPNGQRRESRVSYFRDLEPGTEVGIALLADRFDVPQGRIIDAAIRSLVNQVNAADEANCQTIAENDPTKPSVDLSWILDPTSASSRDDPEWKALDEKLKAMRRQRDDIMGRVPE